MINITKIYLVTNCYNDPNKVYIGKTKGNRYLAHRSFYGNNITYDYIDEVNSLDYKVWQPIECYWIEQFRQWGFEIMNNNKGGGGSSFLSDETKLKMRIAHLGKIPSEEQILKSSIARTGKKHSKTHKNKGIPRSEDFIIKISKPRSEEAKLNMKGVPKPPDFGDKISKALKGRKCSEELIERRVTKERNEKISISMTGKPKSDEHKKNLGLSRVGIPLIRFRKPTLQYDLEGNFIKEWDFAKQAAQELGINYQAINSCILGKIKSSGGFKWKYKADLPDDKKAPEFDPMQGMM